MSTVIKVGNILVKNTDYVDQAKIGGHQWKREAELKGVSEET